MTQVTTQPTSHTKQTVAHGNKPSPSSQVSNHGTETQQFTTDFDANGNLLILNNIGTLH
ncbi:hypothetical protein [uncultured Gammaproteobacteria bacterium]|nr:hypothetical protein [uncultured Gammaproteobacteria bacterium]